MQSDVAFSLLNGSPILGPFRTVAIKLYSVKDGDVVNLQKVEHLYDYFRHSRARGKKLTRVKLFSRAVSI